MLNGKKRAYLRSLANTTKPTSQIGKEGITQDFLDQLEDQLRARELVKVTILALLFPYRSYSSLLLCYPLTTWFPLVLRLGLFMTWERYFRVFVVFLIYSKLATYSLDKLSPDFCTYSISSFLGIYKEKARLVSHIIIESVKNKSHKILKCIN